MKRPDILATLSDSMPDFLVRLRGEMMANNSENNKKIQERLQEYLVSTNGIVSSQDREALQELFKQDISNKEWRDKINKFVAEKALITEEH